MSADYLKQLRQLERQESNLTSQYTDDEKIDPYDYKNITNSSIVFTPLKDETWKAFSDRIKIYAKISAEKNYKTHIDGPRKAWYTHRSPMGCFMCEDTNLISVLVRVTALMADAYPDNTFKST